ncbi:MAG: M24 family metallopeptidase, partial [archaeon]
RGAQFSFDPIISYGKNAALPHAKPTDTKSGICLLCDVGASWKGYHADVTRTLKLSNGGRRGVGAEFDRAYEVVKEAQELAIDAIEPGKTAKDIHDICQNHLKKNGHSLAHSTGHGIGLTIHEWPYIGEKQDKTKLEPGMVFTVEPGVYIKGKFGIRIEDDILVTKTGRKILSK